MPCPDRCPKCGNPDLLVVNEVHQACKAENCDWHTPGFETLHIANQFDDLIATTAEQNRGMLDQISEEIGKNLQNSAGTFLSTFLGETEVGRQVRELQAKWRRAKVNPTPKSLLTTEGKRLDSANDELLAQAARLHSEDPESNNWPRLAEKLMPELVKKLDRDRTRAGQALRQKVNRWKKRTGRAR